MALHYVIDGYNVIHKVPSLWSSSIKRSREKLIGYIQNKKPQGSLKNKVTIVFDGSIDVTGCYLNVAPIEIVFTRQMTADSYIIRLIEKAVNPKIIVVVSDDKGLQEKVLVLNAKAVEVEKFFKPCKKSKIDSDKSSLTGVALHEIKKELLIREYENGS